KGAGLRRVVGVTEGADVKEYALHSGRVGAATGLALRGRTTIQNSEGREVEVRCDDGVCLGSSRKLPRSVGGFRRAKVYVVGEVRRKDVPGGGETGGVDYSFHRANYPGRQQLRVGPYCSGFAVPVSQRAHSKDFIQ
ncbi:unnamed protein product, partial [Discosporangium mesarthrocarpum]